MDIQICQCCGIIIRGKSKFCTGCGTTISKFSPITLPVIAHTAAPLAVTLDPDPLVLERTMVKVRFANVPVGVASSYDSDGAGNGHGNGYGNGNGTPVDYSGQAAAASTSKLQNILGNAAAKSVPGANPNAMSTSMISLDSEAEPQPSEPQEEPIGAIPETVAAEFAPPAPALPPMQEAIETFAPQPSAPMHGSPTRPDRPGSATVTRIVTAAGAFDALAGSTSSTIPVTVTTAINPGADAGSVYATNLSATQNVVPITSAEPPSGLPNASSFPNATTVVAPQTGSPESVLTPPSTASTADETQLLPEPPSAPAPQLTAPVAASAQQDGGPDFFDGAPAAVATEIVPPLTVTPDAVATEPVPSEAPTLVIAPPEVPSAPSPQLAPAAAAAFATAPAGTPFTPLSGVGSSFDFFAQSASPFPAVPTTSPEAASPSLGGLVIAEPRTDNNVLDANAFSNGVPSVVQDAIRAAASASQTNLAPVSSMAQSTDEKTTIVSKDDYPDESVNRGKSKLDDRLVDGSKSDDRAKNGKDKDGEKGDKQAEKVLSVGGKQLKMKSIITIGICVVFGFLVLNVAFGLLKNLVGGGDNAASLGGDWEFGVGMADGRVMKGTVNLQQAGNTFSGMGVDNFGAFRVTNGVIKYPKLQFQKGYIDQQGKAKGKPIMYVGAVDWVNPDPSKGNIPFLSHMYGQWQFQKRDGFGWRGQIVTKTGKWEAGQLRVDKTRSSGGIAPITDGFNPGKAISDAIRPPERPSEWHEYFLKIAFILLGFGVILVAASVKIFGPAGLLNIWSKQEYIPSQFKSQHYKMVREFGGGLKPGGIPLGWRADWNLLQFWWPRKLALPPDARTLNPHILVLGAGSNGKSRLMASMIYHDMESNDRAVVVIDSDGGLIDMLMAKIASSPTGAEIARRVTIIDPTHSGDVFAYNPLEYPDDGDLQNAASAIVFGFKAIYTEPPGSQSQWNQQTANILRNSAVLLMANGKTLTDLPVLLSENDVRDVLLEKVERLKDEKAEYTTLLEAWNQYKRLARTDQWINWVEPILNRVQPMLGDPRIRPILTKPKGDLNLKEIISEGKVLFVKVPQGQLDQNANLLGSLIVTGLKQAAMSLALKGSSKRHPCALYLDEFDNFIEKETYDAITSETKKFQIGFVGSSKTLQGLPEDYRNQIIINVGTACCFALGKKDGDILGPQMFRVDGRKIKYQTLQNIFNKVNTSPQFELISDEEKLNIDRVVGQEERQFFCYRVGTVAGVFQMKSPDFDDVPDKDVNWTLIDQIYARSLPKE